MSKTCFQHDARAPDINTAPAQYWSERFPLVSVKVGRSHAACHDEVMHHIAGSSRAAYGAAGSTQVFYLPPIADILRGSVDVR